MTGRGRSPWLADEVQREVRAGNPVVILDPYNAFDNSVGITLPPEAGPAGSPPDPH